MKVLGIRYCCVSPEAAAMATFFDALGMSRLSLEGIDLSAVMGGEGGFSGAIFLAGESWVEVWPQGPQMPEGTMLQVVVDDADAFATHARANGLEPQGPTDAHGERIYFMQAPGGLAMSFQSKLG